MLPWPSHCFLPHAQLLGLALGRRMWDVSANAAKPAHKRYVRCDMCCLGRCSIAIWAHGTRLQRGKVSKGHLPFQSSSWNPYKVWTIGKLIQQWLHIRGRAIPELLKHFFYKKGVQFWTRFWGQKWVPKMGPKIEPPGTCLIHFPYASA